MTVNDHPACSSCGLPHPPGESFFDTGEVDGWGPIIEDTCELANAWKRAHAQLQPPGTMAYHATRQPDLVLAKGLDPELGNSDCKHICLAKTPEIAAGVNVGKTVLAVDASGLDLYFELGEARHHDTVIEPSRLFVLASQPMPDNSCWSDPAWRKDHTDCLLRRGFPFSRRELRAARAAADLRWYAASREDIVAMLAHLAGEPGVMLRAGELGPSRMVS